MISMDSQIRHHKVLLIIAGVMLASLVVTIRLRGGEPLLFTFLLFGAMGTSVTGINGLFLNRLRSKAHRQLEPAMAAEPTLQRFDQVGKVDAPALAARFATCAEGANPWIPTGVTGPLNLDVLGESRTVNCSGFLWNYRTRRDRYAPHMIRAMGMVALPSQAPSARRVVIRWAGGVSERSIASSGRASANVARTGRATITGTDEALKAAILDSSAQRLLGVSAEPRILEIRGRSLLLVDPNEAKGFKQGMRPQMVDRMLALRREAAQLAEVILTLDQLPDAIEELDGDDESAAAGEL